MVIIIFKYNFKVVQKLSYSHFLIDALSRLSNITKLKAH
jgi:hypothetical protein